MSTSDITTKPAGASNTNGLLTTNDSKSIEVAMRNHITLQQGWPPHTQYLFTWRFLASGDKEVQIITIEAESEQEARLQSPDNCILIFVARISKGGNK
ncbi:host cell division inhibitor Icd-like protein [Salmonella enterica subsp. enterica serovar Newport]|nr:host cell division inhibitor Icd-like protein [Salmonella enterica subsp. enterica serovar Montevideo]ECA5181396.1 host cell division inhibitor Icd-like protein [Salmonella enterica subsp. enterica serovar Newport]ECD4582066.1 host cell division inhibitor Icd-like protein [Salmonella enterica subsp. enterica serovar Newport]